jgi:hypothetical protein
VQAALLFEALVMAERKEEKKLCQKLFEEVCFDIIIIIINQACAGQLNCFTQLRAPMVLQ